MYNSNLQESHSHCPLYMAYFSSSFKIQGLNHDGDPQVGIFLMLSLSLEGEEEKMLGTIIIANYHLLSSQVD